MLDFLQSLICPHLAALPGSLERDSSKGIEVCLRMALDWTMPCRVWDCRIRIHSAEVQLERWCDVPAGSLPLEQAVHRQEWRRLLHCRWWRLRGPKVKRQRQLLPGLRRPCLGCWLRATLLSLCSGQIIVMLPYLRL
jgi:hypothetical protein